MAPFDAACAAARAGTDGGEGGGAGAGTLCWSERPGSLAFAVVLEPDMPLDAARGVFPVAAGALADALAAHCPPERSVAIGWPGTVVYDRGRIGGLRLAWPEGTGEAAVPGWLVFGVDLIADRDRLAEPGRHPESTSLKEEGFEAPRAILESFARHLMFGLDLWQARGHAAACESYVARLDLPAAGWRASVAANGDLLLGAPGGAQRRRRLVDGLAAADWYDAGRGGVRL